VGRGGAVGAKIVQFNGFAQISWVVQGQAGAPEPRSPLSGAAPVALLSTLSFFTPLSSPHPSYAYLFDAPLLNGVWEFSPGRFLNFHITVRKFYSIAERYNLINEYYALF